MKQKIWKPLHIPLNVNTHSTLQKRHLKRIMLDVTRLMPLNHTSKKICHPVIVTHKHNKAMKLTL